MGINHLLFTSCVPIIPDGKNILKILSNILNRMLCEKFMDIMTKLAIMLYVNGLFGVIDGNFPSNK